MLEFERRKLRGKELGCCDGLLKLGLIGGLKVGGEGGMEVRVDHANLVGVGIVGPPIVVDGIVLEGMAVPEFLEIGEVGDT